MVNNMIISSYAYLGFPGDLTVTLSSYRREEYCIYVSVNSSSAHPPPPPRADPRELAFFENELANAPPPGQKKLFKCPGVGAQKCFISFVSRLFFNKSKLIQRKFSSSLAFHYCKNRAFCSSSVPFMSYLDVFKKKLTVLYLPMKWSLKETTML